MLFHHSPSLLFLTWLFCLLLSANSHGSANHNYDSTTQDQVIFQDNSSDPLQTSHDDPLPLSTREHWMRLANTDVLQDYSPCPFMAFGTAIVNHTVSFLNASHLGELVCTGLNHNNATANPILDGEISAIENCSRILTDPAGKYRLSPNEAIQTFSELSIYTNGEPCPMCSGAILWTGFREMVFGTSIEKLVEMGWPQIRLSSREIFEKAWDIRRRRTAWLGSVLNEETDRMFSWQFQRSVECPKSCARWEEGARCSPL